MGIRRCALLIAALLFLSVPRSAVCGTTYVVRKGDSLSRIAGKFHVSVRKIRSSNGLPSDRLTAGMRLRIPGRSPKEDRKREAESRIASGKTSAAGADPPSGPTDASVEGSGDGPPQYHKVRKGETLGGISLRYGVPVEELRRRNELKSGKRLKYGTRIVVRARLPEKYVVREGDTLARVARRFGQDPETITVRNELDSDLLVPGRELHLYDRKEEPTSSAGAACPGEEELETAARPVPLAGTDNGVESMRSRVVRVARKMLAVPYRWGGATLRGIDCSAYVRKVYGFLHLELPRSARDQFRVGEQVSRADLSIGDLVFFRTYAPYPSHVGIYLGDNRFIHASSGSREVRISSLDQPYFVKRYLGARRLLIEGDEGGGGSDRVTSTPRRAPASPQDPPTGTPPTDF